MQLSGFSNNFSSGELAPEAYERSDLAQAQTGCAEAINFIGSVLGPNLSRSGFIRYGATRYEDKPTRRVRWLRADGEGLVLELGEGYARVWTARGAPVLSGGLQVEFAIPYTSAMLPGLRFRQIGDIAIVTHRDGYEPRVITRANDVTWTVEKYGLIEGPFMPENADETLTFTLTFVSGDAWQIAASGPVFHPFHEGSVWRIRPKGGQPGHRSWAPTTAYVVDELIISAGRVYQNMTGAVNSGNTVPIHDRGTVNDGGIDWKYLHDGSAAVKIITVTGTNSADINVVGNMPLADGDVTDAWSEAAFSNYRGWPTAWSEVREERLAMAATAWAPDTIHLTRTAGFTPTAADFKPGLGTGQVVDDDAVAVSVGATRARIVWMVDAAILLVGTTAAEWVVSGPTVDDPITPTGKKPSRLSSYGSSDVEPVLVQGPPSMLLHVARGGTVIRELLIGGDRAAEGRDLSLLSQHIWGVGISEWAWTSAPDNNLWVVLADGSLACFTYHAEQQVMGARRQQLAGGWKAESVCSSPNALGRDQLHVAAYREKNGVMQRACFILADRDTGMFMDCAQQYAGAAATVIGGLNHLIGETVAIFADGRRVDDQVVGAAGAITLDTAATNVWVGLRMLRRFKSLPLDLQGPGSMVARKTRATHAWVVVRAAEADIYVEPQDEPTDRLDYEQVSSRRPEDQTPVVRRLRRKVHFGQGVDRDNRIVVETDEPYDLRIFAIRPVVETDQ